MRSEDDYDMMHERLQKLEVDLTKKKEAIASLRTQCMRQSNALTSITRSVEKLWSAVQEKQHDSRSLVGDETLSMAEQLKELGLGPLCGGGL